MKFVEVMHKVFPFSFREKPAVKDLVLTCVFYVVALTVFVVLNIALFSHIPVVCYLLGIITYLADVYCTCGVVFTFLDYFNVGPFNKNR